MVASGARLRAVSTVSGLLGWARFGRHSAANGVGKALRWCAEVQGGRSRWLRQSKERG